MWSLLLLSVIVVYASSLPVNETEENDGESSRKVLGSSVVTSVSVIMDDGSGTKTYYADAVGKPMAKPVSGSHLASPINLLNPDKYEFYTFDTNGDLVKRLMTLDEIQGIIASGDGEILNYQSHPPNEEQPEKRVDDVVTNVQNVLKEEMEAHKTPSNNTPILDTPDVSSTWSMILPAIFGNSGESISPDKTQVMPTPETIMIDSTTISGMNDKTTPIVSVTERIATKENMDEIGNTSASLTTERTNIPTIEVHITPTVNESVTKVSWETQSTLAPVTTSTPLPTTTTTTERSSTKSSTEHLSTIDLISSASTVHVKQPQNVSEHQTTSTEILSSDSTNYIRTTTPIPTQPPLDATVRDATATTKETTKDTGNFITFRYPPIQDIPDTTTPHQPLSTFFLIDNVYQNAESSTNSLLRLPASESTTTKLTTDFLLQLTPEQIERLSTLLPGLKETTTFRSIATVPSTENVVLTERTTLSPDNLKEIPTTQPPTIATTTYTTNEKFTSPEETPSTYPSTATSLPAQQVNDVEKLAVTELLNQLLYTTDAQEINALSDNTSQDTDLDVTVSVEVRQQTKDATTAEMTTETTTPLSPSRNVTNDVDQLIAEQTHPTVATPLVNIKANEIINETLTNAKPMADVQSEAATVASTIVSDVIPESLNDTLNNKDVNDAVDSLILQIIEQGTLPPLGYLTSEPTQEPIDQSTTAPTTNSVNSEFKINENQPSLTANSSHLEDPISNHNRYEEIDLDVPLSQLKLTTTTASPSVTTELTDTTATQSVTKLYTKATTTKELNVDSTTLINEIVETSATESLSTTPTEEIVHADNVYASTLPLESPFTEATAAEATTTELNTPEHNPPEINTAEATTAESLESSTWGVEEIKATDILQNEYVITDSTFNVDLSSQTTATDAHVLTSTESVLTTTEELQTEQNLIADEQSTTTVRSTTERKDLVTSYLNFEEKLRNATTEVETTTVPEVLTSSSITSTTVAEQTSTTTEATAQSVKPDPSTTPTTPHTTWALVSTVAAHASTEPSENKQSDEKEVSIDLVPKPLQGFGLEDTTSTLDVDLFRFTELCNELAFRFWSSVSNGISFARSVVVSPFAATSMLAMVFLGARGSTSGEMNDILKLDDMVTFNPHAIFKDVIDSIEISQKAGVAASVFAKELYSDKNKGKLLGFYKDRVKYFYDGHVEEVNFKDIGDIIRRRTNLLVKRYTWGKIPEFLRDNSLTLRPPLAGFSANVFQTDCSKASVDGRDGELHFVVLPSIRQRKLVPIPAVVWRTGFLAGYDPGLDATAVSLGTKDQTISTIFVIPGQQGTSAPGDGLFRLEARLVESAFKQNSWSRLLRSLIPRPGLEVQIPRFAHRSVINATLALQKMGLKDLFSAAKADLKGLNGLAHEMYLSDMIQVNYFATCGEGRIDETHHAEVYPATANRTFRRIRKINHYHHGRGDGGLEEPRDYQRSFHDPLFDPSNLALPLPLRPRQARLPEAPRLRFDRPFLYFVRHNPTGLILHMGRFNPRLLP